jgi:hypothetical protein
MLTPTVLHAAQAAAESLEPGPEKWMGDMRDACVTMIQFLADRGLLGTVIGVLAMVLTIAFIFTPVPARRRP